MPRTLLIESRDPFTCQEVNDDFALARELVAGGEEVALFLVQNGVLPARRGARAAALDALVASGVRVQADDLSLRERAIGVETLRKGVSAAALDVALDALERGERVLWL
jgi:sulfur relay (sulfurtransferase) complex TusBCD TusD component (DsrE family)